MLKLFRRNIKAIIWVIVLSFVAWGVGTISISKESASPYIGSVGNEKISQKEFSTMLRYYDILSRVQEKSESNSPEPLPYDKLEALAWQAIILSREAKRQDVVVSDVDVRNEVERTFSLGGQFNQNLYRNWVQNNFQGRARDFEEAIRKHLIVQKFREKVLAGVPEAEFSEKWREWFQPIASRVKFTGSNH